MGTRTLNSGDITFFDYTDSSKLEVDIITNLPNLQIYNNISNIFLPDWSTNHLQLTANVFLESIQVTPSTIKWYKKIGSNKTLIGSSNPITISSNQLNGTTNTAITYICVATYSTFEATSEMVFTSVNLNYVPSTGGGFTGEIELSGNVKSQGIYNQTTTEAANVYVGTSNEYMVKRSSSSSRKYKHDIDNLKSDDINSEKLYELPVREFIYNEEYLDSNDKRFGKTVPGFIAEEVAQFYPIACEYDDNNNPENWNIKFIVPAMLNLIQKQNQEINELKHELDTIKTILNKESL